MGSGAVASKHDPAAETRVYPLEHADAESVAKVLDEILVSRALVVGAGGEVDTKVAIDKRTNSVLVSAPPQTLSQVEALIKQLDVPVEKPSSRSVSATAPVSVRIVWLASGPTSEGAEEPADDLQEVVAELSKVGVKELWQVGQAMVSTMPDDPFRIDCSPTLEGLPVHLRISGGLIDDEKGTVTLAIQLSAERTVPPESGLPVRTEPGVSNGEGPYETRVPPEGASQVKTQRLLDLETRITAPWGHHVVLGVAPVGKITSVFVVQVTLNSDHEPDARTSHPTKGNPTSGITLSGTVTDPQGDPLPGVKVRSDLLFYYQRAKSKTDEVHTLTDAQGRFELSGLAELDPEQAGRTVIFEHPKFALAWFKPAQRHTVDPKKIRVSLVPAAPVAGLVTDRQGRPVVGAMVEPWIQFLAKSRYNYLTLDEQNQMASITDGQGRFVIEKVPEGSRLHLGVKHPRYATFSTRDGYALDLFPIKVGDRDVRVELSPGGMVKGRLVCSGKPLKRGAVVIKACPPWKTSSPPHTLTDAEGRYTFTGLSDGAHVVFVEPRSLPDSDIVCAPVRDVHVKAGGASVEVDLVCSGGQILTGRVLDEETGQPVEDKQITALVGTNWRIEVGQARTDEEGRYRLRLPPGKYQINTFGWRAGNIYRVTEDVDVEPHRSLDQLNFSIGVRPRFSGRLVDQQGRPIEGTVTLGYEKQTAKDGRFAVPVRLEETEFGFALNRDKTLGVGFSLDPRNLRPSGPFVLRPVAAIRGRVVDPGGAPVTSVRPEIRVRLPGETSAKYVRAEPWYLDMQGDGTFVLSAVPTGLSMTLSIRKPSHDMKHATNVDLHGLRPGRTMELGDVVLRGIGESVPPRPIFNATITGRVLDEHKRPRAGVRVYGAIFGVSFEDVTGLEGNFRLAKLPANERVGLTVSAPGYGRVWFEDIATDRNDVELQIFPQGHKWFGKPAPELRVGKWFNTKPLSLAELRGKVVLLQFGSPGLTSDFAPTLDKLRMLSERHPDELVVIGIRGCVQFADDEPVTEAQLADRLNKHRIAFPYAIDQGGTCDADGGLCVADNVTRKTYGVTAWPAMFLIDKKGILRCSLTNANLEQWVTQLLAE